MKKPISLALLLLLAAALAVRIALSQVVPVTGDATSHYYIAEFVAKNPRLPGLDLHPNPEPYFYPPLFPLLGALFYAANALFLLTPLFGFAGVYLTYKIGQELRINAKCCLALAAFAPILLYHSAIGYTDILVFSTAAGAVLYYLKTLNGQKNAFYGAAAFSALAVLTHYHGFVVPVALAAHFFWLKREWKKPAALITACLLAALPAFAHNYALTGNPIFPMLSWGKFPSMYENREPLYTPLLALASPDFYKTAYFDFWVGAPNSGEDIEKNIAVVSQKIPLSTAFLATWLALTLAWTGIILYGYRTLFKKQKSIFFLAALLLALSFPLLIYKTAGRMLMPALPLMIVAASAGLAELGKKIDRKAFAVFSVVSLAAFASVPFAYGFVYKSLVADYLPFYEEIRQKIPEGSLLVASDQTYVMYYAKRTTVPFLNLDGRIPFSVLREPDLAAALKNYNISYVCCSNIQPPQQFCDRFNATTPFIDYKKDSAYGKCWKIQ